MCLMNLFTTLMIKEKIYIYIYPRWVGEKKQNQYSTKSMCTLKVKLKRNETQNCNNPIFEVASCTINLFQYMRAQGG